MIEILNRQRTRKINTRLWREFADGALKVIRDDHHEATIVFVSDRKIKQLNRSYRGKNYATDVLSFRTDTAAFEAENKSNLGDLVISVDRAAAQAKEAGHSFADEVKQLILHGLLHLSGYDHETDKGQMNRLELRLRRRLGI
ncbi:MAG TPA: rRNA maturation RNase YbeY [Pyrinomonadaceae bacterium]|nr:rRNA maturation RNase YbeY [Pyrinomonadaceae bacterium]